MALYISSRGFLNETQGVKEKLALEENDGKHHHISLIPLRNDSELITTELRIEFKPPPQQNKETSPTPLSCKKKASQGVKR